ncbi:MAG: amidohydrolase family protein [Trueperaceae bacterium]|nr:amidohydrolase family protein [Trueperaceae bacterium]
MKIFDAHVHNFWWEGRESGDRFVAQLQETAEEVGIVKIALLGTPGPQGHAALSAAMEQAPGLFCGLGWLRLDEDSPSLIDEFAERGFHGVKILGPRKNYDDEAYYRHFERAQSRGMRILFHTGILGGPNDYLMGAAEDAWKAPPTGDDEERLVTKLGREARGRGYGFSSARMQPIYLDTIAFHFPELFIIGAHLGWPDYRTACAIARWRPRLFFDVSGGEVVRQHIIDGGYVMNEIRPEKLVYGSDSDHRRMKADVEAWRRAFTEMGLTEEQQRLIFYDNAARIYGIES